MVISLFKYLDILRISVVIVNFEFSINMVREESENGENVACEHMDLYALSRKMGVCRGPLQSRDSG